MIGKVTRGTHVGGLLRYLYGPGKENEHTDPHLVAGFCDPAYLEADRHLDGSPDTRRLTGMLLLPLAARPPSCGKPVWHCSVRAAPGDRILSDAEWAAVAQEVMDRTGLAPADDDGAVRWAAVRHAPDHIHIVVTLARQDGARPNVWNDFFKVRAACQSAERRLGLEPTAPADRTAARRPARAETEQA
ncbi:MAG: mobilization protein, partial [Actinomycetota bacterium]|nr:mobilization protein [Actinomycetota bacterium]